MRSKNETPQFKPGKKIHHGELCDKNPKDTYRNQAKSNCPKHSNIGKSKIKVNCGFSKAVIAKGSDGRETCFEEARARAKYFDILSGNNFNYLKASKIEFCEIDKSDMDMDMDMNSTVEDVDMDEVFRSEKSMIQLSKPPSLKKKVLFDVNTSTVVNQPFANRHDTSTASSTVNENDNVGVHGDKEETVNTKFAARELSMMFASPGANPTGLFEQSFTSERQSHKYVPSDEILFSGHNIKRQNSKEIDVYRLRDTEPSFQPFQIFQDDENDGDDGNDDNSSSSIHPEDQGNGDTASFRDIVELLNDNDESGNESDNNPSKNKSERKGILKSLNGKRGFPIFCDTESDVDPASVFGDISFIPQGGDDSTCTDLSAQMKGIDLTER